MYRHLRNIMVENSVRIPLGLDVKGLNSGKRQKLLPTTKPQDVISFKKSPSRNEVSLIVLIYINNRCFIK